VLVLGTKLDVTNYLVALIVFEHFCYFQDSFDSYDDSEDMLMGATNNLVTNLIKHFISYDRPADLKLVVKTIFFTSLWSNI
jgi:hypothetical protein